MSSPLAIAAVTEVLHQRLLAGIAELGVTLNGGAEIPIQMRSPASALASAADIEPQLYLFLYHVERNIGWSNSDLPSRDARGERISNPALALNLYYMITAHSDQALDTEVMLGAAMQVMHETPVLGRETIRDALEPTPGVPTGLLQSGIAEQVEALKITPVPFTADEMSRLWSGFNVPYAPSVAYHVSVVLLTASRATRSPLPVRERRFHLLPFRELRIERIVSAANPREAIGPSAKLRIIGNQIGDPALRLFINGVDVSNAVEDRRASELLVDLSDADPSALRAGVCSAQIVQRLAIGEPPTAREGFTSNVAAFVLVPEILVQPAGNGIDVTCAPAIHAAQRVRLLLNQTNVASGEEPEAYAFDVAAGNGVELPETETDEVHIALPGVGPGEYLVRLQVDGAQSQLTMAARRFSGPKVVL
jgi:hypothetical protein